MNKYENWSLKEFLAKTSLPSPTPGGGSVAALAGALAAALVEMVAGLTLDKERDRGGAGQLQTILKKSRRLRGRLTRGITEDSLAYEQVVRAYRGGRWPQQRQALRRATLVPLRTREGAQQLAEMARCLVRGGRRSALSDARTALLLARAAQKAAVLNVLANLQEIKKREPKSSFVSKMEKRLEGKGH